MGAENGFDLKVFGPFGAMFEPFFAGAEAPGKIRQSVPGNEPPLHRANQAFKAAARCQLEMLGLANRRAQAYLEYPSRLARCRTPQDVLEQQIGFWQNTIEQYLESVAHVTEIWAEVIPASGANPERDYIDFSTEAEASPASSGEQHGPRGGASRGAGADPGAQRRRVA
ncbi:MAG: phasin family protein [Hyphomicrobium sp.]|jgi:hypothetical protein